MKTIKFKGIPDVICLDQFATSGMFESATLEWMEIRKLIVRGVNDKLFVCPMSGEHFLETSQKEKLKAINLDNSFYEISEGCCFKSELFITSQLMISLVRKNNVTSNTYLNFGIKQRVLEDESNMNTFKNLKSDFNAKIYEATFLANKLRESSREKKQKKELTLKLFNVHKKLSVLNFIDRFEYLVKNKYSIIRAVSFTSGDVPHWIDQIIFQLLNKHKMTLKETEILVNVLKKSDFNNIPTLNIKSSLSAIIAAYNKKETVNDQIDIGRISAGLPISKILLTDKQRKSEILDLGLDTKYETSVYSGTKSDLSLLIEDLDKRITNNN